MQVKSHARKPVPVTMLDLIALLQASGNIAMTELELVRAAQSLINSGRVVLTGSYARSPLPIK